MDLNVLLKGEREGGEKEEGRKANRLEKTAPQTRKKPGNNKKVKRKKK